MNMIRAIIPLCLAATMSVAQEKKPNDPAAVGIITKMEAKLNLDGTDVTSTFSLVQRKEGEADRVLKIRVYRRDLAKKFTLMFQYPDSEKGKGYYRDGDNLYLYLPSTREFVFRNRKDDVGSTDVRTDLFGKLDLLEKYRAGSEGTQRVSKFDCDVVRLDATALDVSFPVQKWYIRKSDGLPVKVENFSASNTLLRTFFYIDYKEVKPGKYLFTKLMAVNNLEKSQRTFLTNDDVSGVAIPDYTFSQAFLEEQSR
ncbi:MAG: outer membrane lipoprotein-sorting protein [Chitinispirillaceae bacterium]|nr:outer membrane lipoprotein-sorting protein [Chitinispirillaceae bacterium]